MLDYISGGMDGSTVLGVFAVLVPTLMLVWVIVTVTALHRREVYFWSLSSTWISIIVCPIALLIICLSTWSGLHDRNAPLFQGPLIAGALLYLVAFTHVILHNYSATRSAILALSTSMLQQLAVLGVILFFFRWHANEINRRQRR